MLYSVIELSHMHLISDNTSSFTGVPHLRASFLKHMRNTPRAWCTSAWLGCLFIHTDNIKFIIFRCL